MSRFVKSNLSIVKDTCMQLEGVFDAFTMERLWRKDRKTLTICFTCQKLNLKKLEN